MAEDPNKPKVAPAGAATAPGASADGATSHAEAFLPTMLTETRSGDGDGAGVVVLPAAGYQLKEVIGRGGMGEVVAAHDQRIGRQVALKRMRGVDHSSDALGRFLREARIQARLDHPAIVPVHELGIDAEGNPYFTMKRVSGVTLAQRLADKETRLQALLRAFVEVCLAMDLAHSRGVVHRDLKPSNIILGDYGETYVLDWGVARVLASKRKPTSGGDVDLMEVETQHGSMLGTLGYMSPEQIDDAASVDAASDVYALGAILFEILAREPLHPRGQAALASTISGELTGPAARCPERNIAPELDAVCVEAIARDPAKRPTVRQLADRVQHYLDGDRDVERRHQLAAEQLTLAQAAIASGEPKRRAEAIQTAGRALALHPESVAAAELVTRLIIEPPSERPPELDAQLAASEAERAKSRARNAVIAFSLLLALTGCAAFVPIKDWSGLVMIWFAIAANLVLAAVTMRRGILRTRYVSVTSGLLALALSRIASPLVLVPATLCGAALSVASTPYMSKRRHRPLVWLAIVSSLPFVLEWTGVLASTFTPEPGRLVIQSAVFQTRGIVDYPMLMVANFGLLIIATVFIHGIVRDRRAAERSVEMQAWALKKLLPTQALAPTRSD